MPEEIFTKADAEKLLESKFEAMTKNLVAELKKPVTDTTTEPVEAARKAKGGSTREQDRVKRLAERDRFQGKGFGMARQVIALIKADLERVDVFKAAEMLGFSDVEKGALEEARDLQKSMQASVFESGAAFIAPQFSSEFIGLLQAEAQLMKLNPTSVGMTGESVDVPKLTGGTTAYWVGENEGPTLSDPSTGQKALSLKDLAAATILSLRLLNGASNLEQIVRDQLLRDFGLELSIVGLRSSGGPKKPRGIRHLMKAANILAQTGTSVSQAEADLYRLIGAVTDANVPADGLVFKFHDRVKRGLEQLETAGGNRPFKAGLQAAQPTLLGYPAIIGTEQPTNLGGGSNETEIFFGRGPSLWHGHGQEMAVRVTTEAAVKDGANLRSMWSERSMAIEVFGRHDFELDHEEAFACIGDSTIGTSA